MAVRAATDYQGWEVNSANTITMGDNVVDCYLRRQIVQVMVIKTVS